MATKEPIYTSDYFHAYEVGKSAWAIISRLDSPKDYPGGNSMIVDIGDKTIIFDTFTFLVAARELFSFAKEYSSNANFVVVNSHFHYDHVRGNQIFSGWHISTTMTRNLMIETKDKNIQENKEQWPNAIEQRKKMAEEEEDPEKKHQIEERIKFIEELIKELDEIDVTLPNLTFNSQLVFHGTNKEVHLITYGGAHTKSDVVLYIPEDKVLHGGDLLNNKFHPYIEDGLPKNWIPILKRLNQLNIEIVVPGHGEMGSKLIIEKEIRYFEMLEEAASGEDPIGDNNPFEDYIGGSDEFEKNVEIYKNG